VANACAQPHSVFHIDMEDLISPICVHNNQYTSRLNGYVICIVNFGTLIKYCAV